MVVVSLLLLFGDAVAVVSVLAVDVDVDADAVSGVIPSMGCSVSSAAKNTISFILEIFFFENEFEDENK